MDDIKVSVYIITYKHAKYIRQCLDSILRQKVNFKYEIIVGEDCSNDGTREILLEYQEKYPELFVLLLNEKNVGASQNSTNVRRKCRGQYLVGCEGDDFWVDDYRLQKQADFLDTHPEFVAVGTNTVDVSPEGTDPQVLMHPWQMNKAYSLKHFLRYGFVIHGNTLMRRAVLPEFDEKYITLRTKEPTMGDVITRVVLYSFGKIYVLPDITLAHRSGRNDASSFTAQQKGKSVEHTYMYFRIVDNLTEYYDGKLDLRALKANRLGAIIFEQLAGNTNVAWSDIWKVWKEQTWKIRLWSLVRVVQRFLRKLTHRIARRILKTEEVKIQ